MKNLSRKAFFSMAAACFALALGSSPAFAETAQGEVPVCAPPAKQQAKSVKRHKSKRVKKKTSVSVSSSVVRIAQEHLHNLGYYMGSIDGIMGPQTRAAIKRFQREQDLKVDGILGSQTMRALEYADRRAPDTHVQMFLNEPAPPRGMIAGSRPVHQDYETPLAGGTKVIQSRFARLDVSESGTGSDKSYSVHLDGQPVLSAGGQPAVVGISPTYDLGMEDAIIFTTYSPDNSGCIYRHHVLVLGSFGNKMLDIENCTRSYQARVDNDSLFISFPEYDDKRMIGATWRIEGTTAERL